MPSVPATSRAASSRMIVCEKGGKWAAALRLQLAGDARWIVETRALSQLSQALREHPASLAAIEPPSADLAIFSGELMRLRDEFPLASFVILSRQIVPDACWLLREAGAVHVADSPRRLAPVGGIWRQHRRRHPPAYAGVKETLWERLPWQAEASAPPKA